jgi:hypothetical protein
MNFRMHHLPRLLLWMLILTAPAGLRAQGTYKDAEAITYRLYQDKKWDSLVTAGHRAIGNGIDYYFLRTRMGMAYDAKGRPIRSAWQYDKAIEFNSTDPFTIEKRYFALQNCNRSFDARALETRMTRQQHELLCTKGPVISSISVDLGYTFSNAFQKVNTADLMGADSLYGESDLYGHNYFANLALAFNVSKRLTLVAGGTYLNFAKRKYIDYTYVKDRIDTTINYTWGYQNLYSFPEVTKDYAFDYFITQNEFYLGGVIALDHSVKLFPLFRMISARYSNPQAHYSSSVVLDTSYYVTGTNTYYTFPFNRVYYSVGQRDTSFYNFLVSVAATRDFDFLTFGMSGSWSNLNGLDQLQASAFMTWYPLGNLDLYGNTGVTMLSEEGDGRILLSQMVGGKLTRWLWAEGDIIYGDLSNGNTANGMVVYNNTERIRYRLGARLIITIIRDLEFSINYQFFEKESPVLRYVSTGGGQEKTPVKETTWQKYQTNNIFISINIKL